MLFLEEAWDPMVKVMGAGSQDSWVLSPAPVEDWVLWRVRAVTWDPDIATPLEKKPY